MAEWGDERHHVSTVGGLGRRQGPGPVDSDRGGPRPRHDRGGRGLRDVQGDGCRPLRPHQAPATPTAFGRGAGPARPGRRRGTSRRRRRGRGPADGLRSPPHHMDGRPRAPGLRAVGGTGDARRGRRAVTAVGGRARRRQRAVDPQRARRDRRPQDHVLRGERDRPPVRPRARRDGGAAGQHPRRAVRGDRLERGRGGRGRAGHAAARVGLPGRYHPRADARVVRGRRTAVSREDAPDGDAAGVHPGGAHVLDARRPASCQRSTEGR